MGAFPAIPATAPVNPKNKYAAGTIVRKDDNEI